MSLDPRREATENRIVEVWGLWQDEEPDYDQLQRVAAAAVREFPDCARLRLLYADALVIHTPETLQRDVDNAIDQLEEALRLQPECFEAHESLGYIYDVFKDDFDRAIEHFRQAIRMHESRDSVLGLARSLAQAGKGSESLRTLEESIHRDSPALIELKHEIQAGEWDPDDEGSE